MAEDKKQWQVDPVFKEIKFGIGDMYTRQGRGLIEDDLPSDLGSAKPGKFGAHSRGGSVARFAKGGSVKYGNDYRKK